MRIVDRATFLALPSGTLFSKYALLDFGPLGVKGETLPSGEDFFYQQIADAVDAESSENLLDLLLSAQENGDRVYLDLHGEGRDGLFETGQMYAVWEREDVLALIDRLHEALQQAYPPG